MGKKRKQERTEEEIRRKIKKLEDQLTKTVSINQTSPPDDNLNILQLDTPYYDSLCCESPIPDTIQCDEIPLSPNSPSPRPATPELSAQPVMLPSSPQPGPSTANQGSVEELHLDEDILQLLGDAPKPDTTLGPSIHKDVAHRWQDILAKGLPKDLKDSLIKGYSVPTNCDLLLAPALNPEVKAALQDTLVRRDQSLAYKQRQLGSALSALATVTEMIISNETSKQKLLKPLSDACRILCDSHYSATRTRRSLVIAAINAKLKEALIETSRDKLLFGENVSEKLKAAKAIQQSGDTLKNVPRPPPRFQRPNYVAPTNSNRGGRLNYLPQHRKTDNKMDDRRATNFTQRPPQNSNNARRPPERSVPARNQSTHRR